jgi:hypothetical protein
MTPLLRLEPDKIAGDSTCIRNGGLAMNFRLIVTALVLSSGVAFAQSAELKNAHRAAVAAQSCELTLDSTKSSQLGDAVQRLEQKSGLAQGDLDSLFSEAQAAADADKATFCNDVEKLIDDVIASAE